MNKKIVSVLVVLIIVSAGTYAALNRESPIPFINKNPDSREAPGINAEIPDIKTPDANIPDSNTGNVGGNSLPPAGHITVSGVTTCLPKLGSGEQSMECAIGLKADDGSYYGLRNLYKVDPQYKLVSGDFRIEVSGTFSQEAIKGPDGARYDTVGVIDVTSVKEVK